MTIGWIRRRTGRSLLREQRPGRIVALGDCPRCRQRVEGSAGGWLDAEHTLSEHMRSCTAQASERVGGQGLRAGLRPA